MIELRLNEDRGQADLSWLHSKHSFSFGDYYDKDHMAFSALRVLNDDTVACGAGFALHGHRNMEILTFVIDGSIAHQDSQGNARTLMSGQYQLMSAGTGIRHSEYNPSTTKHLHFLQIWIEPCTFNTPPRYQELEQNAQWGLSTIASPNGEHDSMLINQDARVLQLKLEAKQALNINLDRQRRCYIHLIEGKLALNEHLLNAGDGAKVCQLETLQLKNTTQNNLLALIFDLP